MNLLVFVVLYQLIVLINGLKPLMVATGCGTDVEL